MRTCSRFLFLASLLILLGYPWLPTQAQPVQNGFAAVTCYSDQAYGNPDGIVVALVDVRLAHTQPFNQHWPAPKQFGPGNSWKRSNLGEVFGIAFDTPGNIYVAATSVYNGTAPGGPGGDGAIYRLNGVTGTITNFVTTLNSACGSVVGTSTIPNTGNGLGNIAFDPVNNQLFATNIEDGKIYRISSTGIILSVFDPFAADGCSAGPAPLGERIWGIGVNNGRVYFSRWSEDCGSPSSASANEIWSVALDGSGDFTGTEQLEISVPTLPGAIHSNPVADIAFNTSGRMLLAERTMKGVGNNPLYPNAHASRVLEFEFTGSVWNQTPATFDIGVPATSGCGSWPGGNNAGGGVDYAYGSYNPQTGQLEDCDSTIWASGDALKFSSEIVYGFQRLPATGGNPSNSVLIDADGNLTTGDKRQIGDIEVFRQCQPMQDDPCKGVRVTSKPVQGQSDTDCCFELTITGLTAGTFTSVSAQLLTPSVSFTGVIGSSGWSVTNSGTLATWDSAGGLPGTSVTGLRFCLYSLVSPPQEVEITLHAADGTLCKDTLRFDCEQQPPPFPPCVILSEMDVECRENGPNGAAYDLSFVVTNQSPFSLPPYNQPAENLVVYSATPGVNVGPGAVALSPVLGHGQTSGPLGFSVTGGQPGDTVCIVVQLHGAALPHDYQWCCPPDTVCFVLPPCKDCCDSVDIAIKEGRLRQIGNSGASLSSSVSVQPGPVMSASATVMSVTRSTVWCPQFQPGQGFVYVPTIAGGPILGQVTNASITPALPLSAGLTPPTSEVMWGTVPAGVDMSSGSVGLQLAFPGSSLGWRCRDTLTICVRYSFTDTACRTCDTVVYYTLARRGQIEIISGGPKEIVSVRAGENPLYEGQTGEGTNPLYGESVQGPGTDIEMTSATAGVLSLRHWWQDELEGEPGVHLTEMHLTPEPGVNLVSLAEQGTGVKGAVVDRVGRIPVDLNRGETDLFDLVFENTVDARFFTLRISYRYVQSDNARDTLTSREYLLHVRLADETGGDIVSADDRSERPGGVRTYMVYFVNNNVLKESIAFVDLTIREEGIAEERILAVGPPLNGEAPDRVRLRFVETGDEDSSGETGIVAANHNTTRSNRTQPVAPGDSVIPIFLTVSGETDKPVTVGYTTYDADGNAISTGELVLDDPLQTTSVNEEDERRAVTGSGVQLYPVQPNPGNRDRSVRFRLGAGSDVSVFLYDAAGSEVRRLVEGRQFPAGLHSLVFASGNLPSGTYYVVVKTATEQVSTMMQVIW